METQTKIILRCMGLAGLITLTGIVGNIESKVFDRKIGEENITATEGFDMQRYCFTKIPGYKQTITVSNANHEVFIFRGRKNGTLLNVEHTVSNGCTESYGRYSDKIKPFENMFRKYQTKIKAENK